MRISVLAICLACIPAIYAADAPFKNWKLVWSDEFNGPANTPPDPAKWGYDLGAGGWGNAELETYTGKLENAAEDGAGHLIIRAIKQANGAITSARLKSQGHFAATYGKIAVRMKIPFGQGVWPAFWMLGRESENNKWPAVGEIDVVENIGKEPSVVHGTVHGPGYSGAHSIGSAFKLPGNPPLSDDFHEYAVVWDPNSIEFFLDNQSYFVVTPASLPSGADWVFDHPFYLLLNLAIGGNWPGNPDQTTVFPQSMIVDWVRVWERGR